MSEHRTNYPLTDFMVALWKMPPEHRAKASAERAAARYGICAKVAQFNINEARRSLDVWPIRGGMS